MSRGSEEQIENLSKGDSEEGCGRFVYGGELATAESPDATVKGNPAPSREVYSFSIKLITTLQKSSL